MTREWHYNRSGTQIGAEFGQSFYAPYASCGPPTKVQAQASRIKDALVKAHNLSSSVPTWGSMFWQAVKNERDLYGLEPALTPLLQSHGYIGDSTIGPPREEELRKALQEFEMLGGPSHGTGGSFARVADIAVGESPEQMAWHLGLPPDMQRADPELGECKSETAIMQKLGTSDTRRFNFANLGLSFTIDEPKTRRVPTGCLVSEPLVPGQTLLRSGCWTMQMLIRKWSIRGLNEATR